ncbi:hypothetical protein TNCV_3192431 [Trichonephila clavipes]|nr:hypothetical protein TNCV_3192431 [Trichonephila clavipes]
MYPLRRFTVRQRGRARSTPVVSDNGSSRGTDSTLAVDGATVNRWSSRSYCPPAEDSRSHRLRKVDI